MPDFETVDLQIDRVAYETDEATFEGVLVAQQSVRADTPLILLGPNLMGANDGAVDRARLLARHDRNVFVADIYGQGKLPSDFAAASELMEVLQASPPLVRARMNAALDAARRALHTRFGAYPRHIIAVGFCFGGGNVLELARSGTSLDAFVSIHGSLETAMPAEPGAIKGEVLIAHGAADPIMPRAAREALENELDAAGATWTMLNFGGVVHAFTEEGVEPSPASRYDAAATRLTYQVLDALIERISRNSEDGLG